jgi:alpha-amylase
MDGVLSYPLFYTLRNVFQSKNSLKGLQSALQQYKSAFKNLDLLGTFVGRSNPLSFSYYLSLVQFFYEDNHDNARFLNGNGDYKLYQNAITYVLMGQVKILNLG